MLERDGGVCQLRLEGCTLEADEVDHVIPRELGGTLFDEDNLRASCKHCNRSRGNRLRRKRTPPSQEWPVAKVAGADRPGGPGQGDDGIVIA